MGALWTIRTTTSALLAFAFAVGWPSVSQATVSVRITADNAYAFGFGDVNGVTSSLTGIENCSAAQINGCEAYAIPSNVNLATAYIYIAAWSDDQSKQGLLASFTDGTTTVDSGPVNGGVGPQWEVYSTGEQMDISPSCFSDGCTPLSPPGPPTVGGMNGHIATANAGPSWQNSTSGVLAFGDTNNGTGTTYPSQVCSGTIPNTARWMWRNPNPGTITNPFRATGPMTCPVSQAQDYLIFRIGPIGTVLPPTPGECAFNVGKAKKYKTDMVRAFAACPSATFPSPNSQTGSAVPSCAPPFPLSDYLYAPFCKGQCTVEISSRKEDPCSHPSASACCNCRIKSKCKGILEPNGTTPISGSGWSLAIVWRQTVNDPDNGDMTIIDFAFSIPYGAATQGQLSLQTTCNTLFTSLGLPAPPCCSSTELVDVAIVDPEGKRFAVPGFSCCCN